MARQLYHQAGGGRPEKELEIVADAYEKMRLVCPKCGRKLSRAGSECINCTSKGRLVKKLWAYLRPEKKKLVICLALSLYAWNGISKTISTEITISVATRSVVVKGPGIFLCSHFAAKYAPTVKTRPKWVIISYRP